MRIKKVTQTTPVQAEVVDSLDGNSTTNAPSVRAVNDGLLDKYSTDEQRIGTWIDGKPIYRKVIDTGSLPNTDIKTINHNISNIDNIISIHGWAYRSSDNVFLPLPHVANNTAISCYSTKNRIEITTYADRSSFTVSYIILEYTKTTD